MNRIVVVLLCLMLVSTPALAQEVESEKAPSSSKLFDGKFVAITGLVFASSFFDGHTSVTGVRNGAREVNPIMRPFVNAGMSATYGFEAGSAALTTYAMYKSRQHGSEHWWLAAAIVSSVHIAAGANNLHVIVSIPIPSR